MHLLYEVEKVQPDCTSCHGDCANHPTEVKYPILFFVTTPGLLPKVKSTFKHKALHLFLVIIIGYHKVVTLAGG